MGSTEIECSATFAMRRTGLTCRNLDDHGFHLERDHLRRF
jgi:hypothetical protein